VRSEFEDLEWTELIAGLPASTALPENVPVIAMLAAIGKVIILGRPDAA